MGQRGEEEEELQGAQGGRGEYITLDTACRDENHNTKTFTDLSQHVDGAERLGAGPVGSGNTSVLFALLMFPQLST